MFEILEFTETRVVSVTNRAETHGDEKKPAVSMTLELIAGNSMLDTIDKTLKPTFWKPKDEESAPLPGVEVAMQVLRCNSVERVILPTSHEGYALEVDDGIDETKPMVFGSTKVDKFTFEPKQGGSMVLRLRVGTSDVNEERMGKLGMHVGGKIWIKVIKPKIDDKPAGGDASESGKKGGKGGKKTVIDGTKGHPGAAAAEGQASLLTPEQALADSVNKPAPDAQAAIDAAREAGKWPFPKIEGANADTGPEPKAAAASAIEKAKGKK